MAGKPRILILHGANAAADHPLARYQGDVDLAHADSVPQAIAMLRGDRFDGVYADTSDLGLLQQAGTLLQADRILEMLVDGVVIVDPDLRIVWANATFEKWCGAAAEGKLFFEALGFPQILGPDYSPFHNASQQGPIATCLYANNGRYLQLNVTAVPAATGKVSHYVGVARDITAEHQQQQKLDAIHRAGRQLAPLAPGELAAMSVEERVELLKANIIRYTRELLNYDVMEVRLLDQTTGKLEILLSVGIIPEVSRKDFYARATGYGITGYVASTGKSYLCPDTEKDPLYIRGTKESKCSLTVPLVFEDKVIGTFNVESPEPEHFKEQDQQFLEIFSREIADAVHTLELLVAEKRGTASQSIEAIRREVGLPVDEILTATTSLLDRYIGHDPEMSDRLRKVLAGARSIKECIQKVGETLTPAATLDHEEEPLHPRLRGLRILLADNDDRVRRSAHSLLGRFGSIVETARDGKEALMMARLGTYDVVLADIRLPDMSGYEFFFQCKQAQPKATVVLMREFGYDASHSIVKARQEGLKHVLYKPFRVDQLLEVLEKVTATESSGTVTQGAA